MLLSLFVMYSWSHEARGPPWGLEETTLYSHLKVEEESELVASTEADVETEGAFRCLYRKETKKKNSFCDSSVRRKTKTVSRKQRQLQRSLWKRSLQNKMHRFGEKIENDRWYIVYTSQWNTTRHQVSLDSLGVHLTSGCVSCPEPEISENAWGDTLKSNSLSILWKLDIPKVKNRFLDGMRKVWKRNGLYSCLLLTLSLEVFISCKP